MSGIPYRITIELAVGAKGKTIQIVGETPAVGDPQVESNLTAAAANALIWESHAMAVAAGFLSEWEAYRQALNLSAQGRVM